MTKPVQFGNKYLLLDKLGRGGMADIYRAKLLRDEGFEKIIVIKKLLEHFNSSQNMTAHFIDEARLAAHLQHENIACIYDFGNIKSHYFIAMEYLFGKDLHTFLEKSSELHGPLFPEFALHITAKICEAMSYAHSLTDLQNRPLNIIHRDLTPHNIFLTYDGKVKILDFGIAKNELQENKTEVGVVKGKISYMSPEQLSGEEIDLRSDIFTIGIMLYEMVSGKKLYTGNTAELIKKAVTADYIPLKEITKNFPQKLYDILDKSIALEAKHRYHSCDKMLEDIEDCLSQMSRRVTTNTMKEYMQHIFADEYANERRAAASIISGKAASDVDAVANTEINVSDEEKTQVMKAAVNRTSTKSQPQKNNTSEDFNIKRFIIAGVAVLVLLIATFFLLRQFTVSDDQQNIPKEQSTVATVETKTSTDEAEHEKKISGLLLDADNSFESGNLIGPSDSAHALYSKALALDGDNKEALEGLDKIYVTLLSKADKLIQQKKFTEAKETLNLAKTIYPKDPQINELEKKITQSKKQSRQSSLKTYSQKAQQRIQQNKLTLPTDDCALLYCNKMNNIDPKNSLTKDCFYKIADRYADIADNHFKNLNLDSARHYVAKGLEVVPDHPRLLNLQVDLHQHTPGVVLEGIMKNIFD